MTSKPILPSAQVPSPQHRQDVVADDAALTTDDLTAGDLTTEAAPIGPETLAEALAASAVSAAAARMGLTRAEIDDARRKACAEYIDLLCRCVETPAGPEREAVRVQYLAAKQRYMDLGGGKGWRRSAAMRAGKS
jgi:hypothetical protein